MPNIDSKEGQLFLQALSDDIAYKIGEFLSINTCPTCGKSLSHGTATCEYCGNMHDKIYEGL
ncbi:MAG: hypothetical protein WC774_00645 [Candidatus Gracilibacteria bacterium]|jgi:hypothetical protein